MDLYYPLFYMGALGSLLTVVGVLVFREVIRNRQQEGVIRRLQGRLTREKGLSQDHYELGSVYLSKKLYDQAILQFKKALDTSADPQPKVSNALGFAYFIQEQYDLAIRYYKEAVEADPLYLTAWNNLGHAYEKKSLTQPGLDAYEKALALDPKNAVAKRRADSLRKRLSPTLTSSSGSSP